jgi:hypothetical protein
MGILTAADKPTYFPSVTQTGAALEGLLALAQALCESYYGANRPLELQQFKEIVSVNLAYRVAVLTYYPIATSPALAVEAIVASSGNRFGRVILDVWSDLRSDEYRLDIETGELWIATRAIQARATYTAGFNFGSSAPDVLNIKAIAGQIVTYFANYRVGLDSYLSNPPGNAVESYNLVRPDQYLTALLLPLRKYMPRRSLG